MTIPSLTARLALAAAVSLALAGAATAQTWYDGTGNRWDYTRATVDQNPMFSPSPSFSVPPLPAVPDASGGGGGGPWGTSLPTTSYRCTMPGCD